MKNREQWLTEAADDIMGKFFDYFELHFPGRVDEVRILASTGFPSAGGLTKVVGQCWKSECSEGKSTQIFINPRLTDIVEVVAVLAHEVIHALDDCESKHRGKFVKAFRDIGLVGKATASEAGEEFAQYARDLEKVLGPYPHELLTPLKQHKKQSTRMLKLECECCGYIVRTTKKWLEIGVPSCPKGEQFPLPEGFDPEEGK